MIAVVAVLYKYRIRWLLGAYAYTVRRGQNKRNTCVRLLVTNVYISLKKTTVNKCSRMDVLSNVVQK